MALFLSVFYFESWFLENILRQVLCQGDPAGDTGTINIDKIGY
jgi:hypothetical protein